MTIIFQYQQENVRWQQCAYGQDVHCSLQAVGLLVKHCVDLEKQATKQNLTVSEDGLSNPCMCDAHSDLVGGKKPVCFFLFFLRSCVMNKDNKRKTIQAFLKDALRSFKSEIKMIQYEKYFSFP